MRVIDNVFQGRLKFRISRLDGLNQDLLEMSPAAGDHVIRLLQNTLARMQQE